MTYRYLTCAYVEYLGLERIPILKPRQGLRHWNPSPTLALPHAGESWHRRRRRAERPLVRTRSRRTCLHATRHAHALTGEPQAHNPNDGHAPQPFTARRHPPMRNPKPQTHPDPTLKPTTRGAGEATNPPPHHALTPAGLPVWSVGFRTSGADGG